MLDPPSGQAEKPPGVAPDGHPPLGYSWRALTPLPLLAALLGVAVVLGLTMASMTSAMQATDKALVTLTARSHDAGHLWVDVATEYADTAEMAATGSATPAAILGIEQAAADAQQRFADLRPDAGSPEAGIGALYARLVSEDQVDLLLQQALLQAVTQGRPDQVRVTWQRLHPALQSMEADAHSLFHASYDAYPQQVSVLTEEDIRVHRRLLALAFGLVAVEFAAISVWAARIVARPLQHFAEAAAAVRDGNLEARLPRFAIREFTTAADGFNAMAASLRHAQARAQLEHRQALELREERAALIQRQLGLVIGAQEEERRRVARDLHDETAQALTAVHLGLQHLVHGLPPAVQDEVQALQTLVRDTMSSVRDLATNLHPHILDEMGLASALQEWLGRLAVRVSFELHFECDDDVPRLPDSTETAVFRIAQEAVTNAARHAATARTVQVGLWIESANLHLRVEDDGCGFDPAAGAAGRSPGLGLLGIRERARQIGAVLQVDTSPGKGTRVRLCVPLPVDPAVARDPARQQGLR